MRAAFRAGRVAALVGATFLIIAVSAAPVSAASQLPGHFFGEAWGSHANAKAGNLAASLGYSAYQPCPCKGTGGAVRATDVSSVNGGKPYRSGRVTTTAQAAKQSGSQAFDQMTSTTHSMRALDGVITAQTLRAVATTNANASGITANANGSSIVGLTINGHSWTAVRGQRVSLPGFGYATFNNVNRFGDAQSGGINVDMMRIVITRVNSLNIPVGSVITAGHARSGYSRSPASAIVGALSWGAASVSDSQDVRNESGSLAPTYLQCLSSGTNSNSNHLTAASLPGTFTTGKVVNTVSGQVSESLAQARATSRVDNVSLMNGLITADSVLGVATANLSGNAGGISYAGSRFVNLRVNGRPIGSDVAPNTTIAIPGVGSVTLFETFGSADPTGASATVNMIVLHVNYLNPQGVPAGSAIKIAHAHAEANR